MRTQVILIGNGSARYIDPFKKRFYLDDKSIKVFTDPSLTIYKQMNLKKSIMGVIGFSGIFNFLKFMGKGLKQSGIEGNNSQQGGTLLIDDERNVRYFYSSQYLGDNGNIAEVMKAVTTVSSEKMYM